jgi:hypothetical protein
MLYKTRQMQNSVYCMLLLIWNSRTLKSVVTETRSIVLQIEGVRLITKKYQKTVLNDENPIHLKIKLWLYKCVPLSTMVDLKLKFIIHKLYLNKVEFKMYNSISFKKAMTKISICTTQYSTAFPFWKSEYSPFHTILTLQTPHNLDWEHGSSGRGLNSQIPHNPNI